MEPEPILNDEDNFELAWQIGIEHTNLMRTVTYWAILVEYGLEQTEAIRLSLENLIGRNVSKGAGMYILTRQLTNRGLEAVT